MANFAGWSNVLSFNSEDIDGDGWTQVVTTAADRDGVIICNPSAHDVWVRFVGRGMSAPSGSPSANTAAVIIQSGQSYWYPAGDDVDIYAANDLGTSTTSKLNVTETA